MHIETEPIKKTPISTKKIVQFVPELVINTISI